VRRRASRGRTARACLAALLLAAATPAVAARATGAPARAADAVAAIFVDGRGNGHGIGLGQWGAYGYAVDHGWSSTQILDHYYGGTVAGTAPAGDVEVRLMALDDRQTAVVHDRSRLVVDGVGGGPWAAVVAREVAPGSHAVWARGGPPACPGAADALAGWSLVATGRTSVTIRTADDTSASTDPADLVAVCEPGGRVRSYRGAIRRVEGTAGEDRTVNVVPLEQYLRAVVASEVSPSWAAHGGGRGVHALRAQAVAARSYVLAERRWSYAGTCDLTCQRYPGAAHRTALGGAYTLVEHPATDSAVAATAGQVRRVGSATGPIALTMYSASTGGRTAPSTLAFPAVDDLGDATAANPHRRWSVTVPASTIERAWPSIGALSAVEVTARDGGGEWGGRATSVRLTGTAGTVVVTGERFRSTTALRSTWFSIGAASPPAPPPAPAPDPGPPAAPAPPPGPVTCGDPGTAAPPVDGAVPARLRTIDPVRLLDTREGPAMPLGAGCTIVVRTAERSAASHGATAVAVNVTTVDTRADGFVTAYPCGIRRPFTATVQPVVGRIVGGAAIVPIAPDGTLCLYANVTTHVVVDLFGVFAPDAPGRFEPVEPERRFDTRPRRTPLAAGQVVRVPVGRPGATAAALTVHALDAAADGFVTAWPCDSPRPFVSAANVMAASSVTNHVEVAVGPSGDVCLFVNAPMHVAVDLSGWYGPAGSTDLHAVTPFRVADTREAVGIASRLVRLSDRALTLAGTGGPGGVPPRARAVAAQVTAVDPASSAYLTVHPCRTPVPGLSMLRVDRMRNAAVLVTGVLDGAGRWCVTASAATDLVVDVTAWFG